MRVIAGTARSLQLKTLEGTETRPTLDRYKETLFNVIQSHVPGSKFLDIFAGCGGIGIEALSRGAERAVFIDNSKKAIQIIKENLEHTGFSDKADVITADAITGLMQLDRTGPYDVIFMDPPYNKDLEKQAIEYLSHSKLISKNTLVIAEASNDTDFSFVSETGFMIIKIKEYKTNKHIFMMKDGGL